MSSLFSPSPSNERRSSRLPGEFDPEEFEEEGNHTGEEENTTQRTTEDSFGYLPQFHGSVVSRAHNGASQHGGQHTDTFLQEREMNDKLLDVESSFLPEFSHLVNKSRTSDGADDSLATGTTGTARLSHESHGVALPHDSFSMDTHDERSPQTPPGSYKTPAPEQQMSEQTSQRSSNTPALPNTSALETMSSSPMAAAAQRTVSRVQSQATLGGYETADDLPFPESPSKRPRTAIADDNDATPRKSQHQVGSNQSQRSAATISGPANLQSQRRPKFLNSRTSQSRLSYDSIASATTDTSDATRGADFALQSGGAMMDSRRLPKTRRTLSRTESLGSLASGMSGASDDEERTQTIGALRDLSTLQEESPRTNDGGRDTPIAPITPRPPAIVMPTDTVIANNVRDLDVPGTFARAYRQERGISPDKTTLMAGMTPGPKRGLTLKEHRSTVEKLGKENFDLKMKIHFLDQALQKRSEDGIKEMITENVQLKSDRLRIEKDNHNLRKQVRELQRKLHERGRDSPTADQGYGTDEDRSPTAAEELIYLRERVETNEIEIEKLRTENVAKESEKRRLAEMVRSLGDTRAGSSDVGSREERDMWKDMLEAETIAREQSEEDNKKLREEMTKLRNETFGAGRSLKQRVGGSVLSRSSSVEGNRVQAAELERLRHEVSELQKMISAQASTLTSRNKEKERLYQEIEDLKLGRMGGVRSVAGDSILDRSASRARSHSRASAGTRMSRMSDQERESLEIRINDLRDESSQLKLDNQNLQNQLDEAMAELDAVDAQAQADADAFNEELHLLTQERDNAFRDAEEQDQAFQQLKNEAQEEIDGLGDELDAKVEECNRLEQDLKAQAENAKAMQSEVRLASEGLIRLEEDAQHNLARYNAVKAELDDANRELERFEKNAGDVEAKLQRLTVQQESSHNEIAFLREEQDGDKIKIGDLESLLKKVHLNLDSERDKTRDLERRIMEERHQKEAVASQEKQDVQRMINDLNREASTAKDEVRRLKKGLQAREIESNGHRERLTEFEASLRHVLGDEKGTRSNMISTVTKIQRELDQATVDLDATRRRLDERETLLTNRDTLLESSGLEYRKLADALDRERQARRQDKHSFEQSLRSHQQSARALTANSTRIADLEQQRQADRKRLTQVEAQFKEQLAERNQVLLTIWKKLSTMCGPDWAHNNSLINGNLPSQEVIGNILFWPGFSRNLLLATKQVESTLMNMRDKMKRVERELWKEYQALEQALDLRTKKLERIEESWERMKLKLAEAEAQLVTASSSKGSRSSKTAEIGKLKGENKLLRAELQLIQQQQYHAASHARQGKSDSRIAAIASSTSRAATSGPLESEENSGSANMSMDGANGIPARSSSMRRSIIRSMGLSRSHTTSALDHAASEYTNDSRSNSVSSGRKSNTDRGLVVPTHNANIPANGNFAMPPHAQNTEPAAVPASSSSSSLHMVPTGQSGDQQWIHRLRELERRLKAEREARLLDRSGARQRLEERDAVNEELRRELERERVIRRSMEAGVIAPGTSHSDDRLAENNVDENGVSRPPTSSGPAFEKVMLESEVRPPRKDTPFAAAELDGGATTTTGGSGEGMNKSHHRNSGVMQSIMSGLSKARSRSRSQTQAQQGVSRSLSRSPSKR